jgi:Fe-S-cluster containining protein
MLGISLSRRNNIFSLTPVQLGEQDVLVTEQQVSGYKSAQQKLEILFRAHPWIAPDHLQQSLARIVSENASARSKRRKVIEIANRVTTALAPHVPCKQGCISCCHMNTMIYEHEAIHLANKTGRKIVHLAYRPLKEVFNKGKEFIGKPCPFLLENKCSVYEDRPLVCRTHHSLYEDATWCSSDILDVNPIGPPMYDPDIFETPYRHLNAVYQPKEPWGNIGEFFPE